MSWRAPSIASGTTLLAYYPGVDYADDTDIVWGPANYIYFPGPQTQLPVRVSISALTTDTSAINNLLLGHDPQESTYRAHTSTLDYAETVVIVQSAEDACVRVMDPRWPMLSLTDDPSLRLLAPVSRVENIQAVGASRRGARCPVWSPSPSTDGASTSRRLPSPASKAIGSRSPRSRLRSSKLGLHPNDQIEWMPFLQAQAYLGDLQQVKQIASRINTEKLYKQQACQNLGAMADYGYPLSAETQALVDTLFCGAKP